MRRTTLILVSLILILAWKWMMKHQQDAPNIATFDLNYMQASFALAEDDFDQARESLQRLARGNTGELREKAQSAADAGDIAAMRELFKTLTEEVVVNMSIPYDYAIAYCPRFKNGSKWIQKREDPIANPYLGKSVPPCGSFVD